jgi:transposase-like protein
MKTNPNTTIKGRRSFDRTFKREAVALWLNSNKPAQEVGLELGIHKDRLYSWRKLFAPTPPGGKGGVGANLASSDLALENEKLRREVQYLRQQRDILKKTLGILSEPPSSVTKGSRP